MPQLSFAELIERDVPLAAAEAVALTLAAATVHGHDATRHSAPALDEVLLSSSGEVTLASPVAEHDATEAVWLTTMLCSLLRLDEPEHRTRCRGRVPGGLLVLVARMRGQIDLPPLALGPFRDSLNRFSAAPDPSLLAAIFWRAARMRPRQTETAGAGTRDAGSAFNGDRRARGPSASELRKWLRQTERELFALRRNTPLAAVHLVRGIVSAVSRPVSLLILASIAIAAGFWAHADEAGRPARSLQGDLVILDSVPQGMPVPRTGQQAALTSVRLTTPTVPVPPRSTVRAKKTRMSTGVQQIRPKTRRAAVIRPAAPPPIRTVRLVNLPRTPWVEVQTSSGRRRD